jgi:hypothetical protein
MKKKTVEIDFESLEDIQHWINVLKSEYSSLRKLKDPTFISKNERVRKQFEACQGIVNTDIHHIYSKLNLDESPIYYVYAHCDPGFKIALKKNGKTTFGATLGMTHVPFYIGKGKENRAYDLNRNDSHRKVRQKIQNFGKDIIVTILKEGLTELEALCLESKLIDIFGLISQRNGHLVNLDEGVAPKDRQKCYKQYLDEISILHQNIN